MKATVSLDHGMTFLGTADSGHTIQMGASTGAGGEDDGPRPMELLLIGLGGCTGMDVISILRKKRQQVTAFNLELEASRADQHPHIFTEITIKYVIHGRNVDPKAVDRAIALSRDRYCPAQAIMALSAEIHHTFEIIEEEPEKTS